MCPTCRNHNIQKLDVADILCSWVDNIIGSNAIFNAKGYYKDGIPSFYRLSWARYFEKELVNFDGTFKRVVSALANASRHASFRLMPDVHEYEKGSLRARLSNFEVCYPFIPKATKQAIPNIGVLRLVDFLKSEGALKEDGIAFSFCPSCGSKNKLEFGMEENGCEVCSMREDPPCGDECEDYDAEIGECRWGNSIGGSDCCFLSPNGDCDGPKTLVVECAQCGEGYTDGFVELKDNRKEVDAILNPNECECFAIRYKPIQDVLNKLNHGFTFQEIILDRVKNQGWNASTGKKRGKSGVDQDVDILCEKDSERILVECKRSKSVSLDTVFNLFARIHDLDIKKGLIVTTTQRISNEAQKFAKYYKIPILYVGDFLKQGLDNLLDY